MIVQETLPNGFIKTYSDQEGYVVRNTKIGDTFLEAIDDPAWGNEYEEYQLPDETEEKGEIE